MSWAMGVFAVLLVIAAVLLFLSVLLMWLDDRRAHR
jgi:hypothetical protein